MFLIQLLSYKGKEDSSLLSFLCSSRSDFFLSVVAMHPCPCSSLYFFFPAFLPFPLLPAPLSPLQLLEDQLNTHPPRPIAQVKCGLRRGPLWAKWLGGSGLLMETVTKSRPVRFQTKKVVPPRTCSQPAKARAERSWQGRPDQG